METFKEEVRDDVVDVPNGVDATACLCRGLPIFEATHGISDEDFIFVFVGRLQPVKCIPYLIKAFAQMHEACNQARLVIIGSGPEEKEAQALCVELSIQDSVSWLGELGHSEIPDSFRSSEVMIIPSWYESFSFVALEAMASGIPVITTDTDWIPRMVQDRVGGRVVPIKDVDALAEAMLGLYNDKAFCTTAGERNREYVLTHYTWGSSAQKLLSVYTDLVQKPDGSP